MGTIIDGIDFLFGLALLEHRNIMGDYKAPAEITMASFRVTLAIFWLTILIWGMVPSNVLRFMVLDSSTPPDSNPTVIGFIL